MIDCATGGARKSGGPLEAALEPGAKEMAQVESGRIDLGPAASIVQPARDLWLWHRSGLAPAPAPAPAAS